jgi:hypothetical protein
LLLLYDEDCDEAFPPSPSSRYSEFHRASIVAFTVRMVQATIQNTGSISTESPRYRFRVKAWCWLFSFPRHCSSWIPSERRAACTYYIIKNITSYSCSYHFFSTVSFFFVVPSHVGAPFYFCAYSISILFLIQLETPNGDAL